MLGDNVRPLHPCFYFFFKVIAGDLFLVCARLHILHLFSFFLCVPFFWLLTTCSRDGYELGALYRRTDVMTLKNMWCVFVYAVFAVWRLIECGSSGSDLTVSVTRIEVATASLEYRRGLTWV